MKMDFRHADRAPAQKLNVILWKDAMGSKPVPAMLTAEAGEGCGRMTTISTPMLSSGMRLPRSRKRDWGTRLFRGSR